jgi:hypothetical protein
MRKMNSAATTSFRAVAFIAVAFVVVIVPLAVALFFTAIAFLTSSDAAYLGSLGDVSSYLSGHGASLHVMFFVFCALAVVSWFVFAFIMFSVFSPNEKKPPAKRRPQATRASRSAMISSP